MTISGKMTITRISTAAVLALGGLALAAPAAACDMHGAGYGSPFGMQWQVYTPRVSTSDPAFAPEGLAADFTTPLPAASAVAKKPAKPSFSTAATRASQRALASRASKKDAKPDAAVKKASLDTSK